MKDQFERQINYLRISVTDLCNLRCVYCMPEDGVQKRGHQDVLRTEEILEITGAAAGLGVNKVRVTGGEPLIKPGIVELCRDIARIPGIEELSITTNGVLLADMAADLKNAGVCRVNISLDTLDADKYREVTRGGDIRRILRGIEAAQACGLTPVKLNAVLMNGFNDDEIERFVGLTRYDNLEMRFIELMPIGEGIELWENAYLPNEYVLEKVPELMPVDSDYPGVARRYSLPGAVGKVGLINPVSSHFCKNCNRIRLTADGKLKPCLHSEAEVDIRGLHGRELLEAMRAAVLSKPKSHEELSAACPSGAGRRMNQIGG